MQKICNSRLFLASIVLASIARAETPFVSPIGDDAPVRWTNIAEAQKHHLNIEVGGPDLNDPYAPEAVMIYGQHKGKRVDLTFRRPALVRRAPAPGIFRVANVFFNNEFWIADIPLAQVKDVFLQQHNFAAPLPVAHLDHFVQMEEGASIHLTSQLTSEPTRTVEIPALEISADATGPKGIGFGGLSDVFPNAVIAMRVTGMGERVPTQPLLIKVSDQDPKNPFFRFHYAMADAGAAADFLVRALELSQAWGFLYPYNLICRNCTTTAYLLERVGLEGLSNYREPAMLGQWLLNKLPQMTAINLRLRGIYEGPKPSKQPIVQTTHALPNPKSGGPTTAPGFIARLCEFFLGKGHGSAPAAANVGGGTVPPERPR